MKRCPWFSGLGAHDSMTQRVTATERKASIGCILQQGRKAKPEPFWRLKRISMGPCSMGPSLKEKGSNRKEKLRPPYSLRLGRTRRVLGFIKYLPGTGRRLTSH